MKSWRLLVGLLALALAGPVVSGEALSGRVSLTPPAGFEPAADGATYTTADGKSIIRIEEIAEPVAKVEPVYSVPALESEGATMLTFEKVTLGEQPGTLISVLQRIDGVTSERWVLVFGTTAESVVLNAAYPRKQAGELREAVKAALLGVRWAPAAP